MASGGDKQTKGVDNTFRRTWDKEAAMRRAAQREANEFNEPLDNKHKAKSLNDMKPLEARDGDLDILKNVGKTVEISSNESKLAGFYCELCDAQMKDSIAYMDHLNGRKHQRMLGTSLVPERATVLEVRERLQMAKQKTLPSKKESFENKMKSLQEAEERRRQNEEKERQKELKKEAIRKKKEKKKQEQEQEVDPDLIAMGLPMGFGTSANKGKQ
eukprot:TRINITY_DN4107_c0_g1_i1.p1 TRINITY_DN4107_c0_g1~~TRINITY_DN4107_c0_g1_i1.p1  ORF type:complete len:215 (+),score=75.10 TRINITY_DN4107_c0_g1_i1:31-675(+)